MSQPADTAAPTEYLDDREPAPRNTADEPQPIPFRIIALIWCVPAILAGVQAAMAFGATWSRARMWSVAGLTALAWLGWALLTPPIVALTRRFPLHRDRLWQAVSVHVLASTICATLLGVVWGLLIESSGARRGLTPAENGAFARWLHTGSPVGHVMIAGFTYACIVAAVIAIDARRRAHRTELAAAWLARDVARAREQAIKMQVHPHFLFNTLHALSVLITEEPTIARSMVIHLGDFLRATLERAHRSEVTLQEELELLGHYRGVEQLRFGDRLTVEICAAPDTLDALVPDLVLQPLLENAIKHGVSSRPGPHLVQVSAHRDGPQLVLVVNDDGAPSTSERRPEGVGLRTTRDRLAHLYGSAHELTLCSRAEGGMRATVRLPYHVEPLRGAIPVAAEEADDA